MSFIAKAAFLRHRASGQTHWIVLTAVLIALSFAATAFAGNIFDDDFVPPAPAGQSPAEHPGTPARPVTAAPPTDAVDPPTDPAPGVGEPAPPQNPNRSSPRSTSVATPPRRQRIPEKSKLTGSRKLLKEVFADKLKDRSVAARKALAQSLLDEADKSGASPADQFALITGAIEAAKQAGDLRLVLTACERLSANFRVDELKLKTDAAIHMTLRAVAPADSLDNVRAGLELVDSLAGEEDFTDAFRILGLIRPLAGTDPELRPLVNRQTQSLEATHLAYEKIQRTLAKLKTSPDDPAANLAVGRFYCLRLGRWDRGLVYLARSRDKPLRNLAGQELSAPSDPVSALKLAGDWWDLAEAKGTPTSDAKAIKIHAATWYRAGRRAVTGLAAKVVELRLQQAASIAAGEALVPGALGPRVITNSIGIKFIRIDPGAFLMGSPMTEKNRRTDEKQHKVMLTRPFYMGVTLVTQAQWDAVMRRDSSRFKGEKNPVEQISWNDAMEFCQKLSEKDGKAYRLPTEAQWEYACRAGSTSPYGGNGNISEMGWYNSNCNGQTHSVATKKPNAWGLYDMHGSVYEWCGDCYGEYPNHAVIDPQGPEPTDKARRVLRGGSWYEGADACRAANRVSDDPTAPSDRYGLRVCRDD
ncbi:MAG TPA: SUMF1/EgtB/PvdO family nonheme iron enzyme [Tepidisphaeraceae bacterium]|nr:SUMF1/EgtB/PvdO family nonheme iron enzyme [Tepidisphaeraceae bacterium]